MKTFIEIIQGHQLTANETCRDKPNNNADNSLDIIPYLGMFSKRTKQNIATIFYSLLNGKFKNVQNGFW